MFFYSLNLVTKQVEENSEVTILNCTAHSCWQLICEDIHLDGSQQCHEPARGSSGTKSTQGRTRPVRKVTFSQSRPTTIRPDLNNFSAWLRRSPRPGPQYRTYVHVSSVCDHWTAHLKPEPFLHLTFWMVYKMHLLKPYNGSPHHILYFAYQEGSKFSKSSRISWAIRLTSY